ncbi:MAG: YfhO family protein, partial [Flavobacteriales bacterium]
GNAWYVSSVKLVESDNDEILEFKNINPKQEAVVHKDFENQLGKTTFSTTNNQIRLTDYKANHLQYQVNNQSEGLAVFSEIYYEDGWNAYVDGKKVDHLRANYLLRALKLPAGDYTVEFKFEPSMYSAGNWINIISFLIILLMLALGIKSCLKPANT